jgi:hypothetical protein
MQYLSIALLRCSRALWSKKQKSGPQKSGVRFSCARCARRPLLHKHVKLNRGCAMVRACNSQNRLAWTEEERDILSISPTLQNQNRNSVRSAKIKIQNLLFRNGDVKHFSMTTFVKLKQVSRSRFFLVSRSRMRVPNDSKQNFQRNNFLTETHCFNFLLLFRLLSPEEAPRFRQHLFCTQWQPRL